MKQILILVKNSFEYGVSGKPKAGLFNSARLLAKTLNEETEDTFILKECIDGNDIDNKLHLLKPDMCIIEAIWVTPTKLRELTVLHPKVLFIVRAHSKTPFLSMEGTALSWLREYSKIANVAISFNNEQTSKDFNSIGVLNEYLPNLYDKISIPSAFELFRSLFQWDMSDKNIYRIGCFGAIRPFKNHLNQAVAAIKFAESRNATVKFFVNAGRTEQSGENVLKNLRALFEGTPHELIELGWFTHDQFLTLIDTMDMCLQVSYTESFNIVAADSVIRNTPIVASKEISWLELSNNADPNDVDSIVREMSKCMTFKSLQTKINRMSLNSYNDEALHVWKHFLDNVKRYNL